MTEDKDGTLVAPTARDLDEDVSPNKSSCSDAMAIKSKEDVSGMQTDQTVINYEESGMMTKMASVD